MLSFIASLYTAENIQDIFNPLNFRNSIEYSIGKRSSGSEYVFSYSGTQMKIKGNPEYYNIFPQFSHLIIYVNNIYQEIVIISNGNDYHEINFNSGQKEIKIVEGLLTKPSTIMGTYITSILLDVNKYSYEPQPTPFKKMVFLGDSITVGGNALVPSKDGFASLFKAENEVAILGYGYGKIKDFGENIEKINETVGFLTDIFTGVNTKKLVIALGTNDFALDTQTVENISLWFENLLNAINLSDSNVSIFCISPLNRNANNGLLDSYRTAIESLCSSRDYCTYINGFDILDITDLDDGTHPHTQGHLKYYNEIKDTVNV